MLESIIHMREVRPCHCTPGIANKFPLLHDHWLDGNLHSLLFLSSSLFPLYQTVESFILNHFSFLFISYQITF
jgi:hypothetical protein